MALSGLSVPGFFSCWIWFTQNFRVFQVRPRSAGLRKLDKQRALPKKELCLLTNPRLWDPSSP